MPVEKSIIELRQASIENRKRIKAALAEANLIIEDLIARNYELHKKYKSTCDALNQDDYKNCQAKKTDLKLVRTSGKHLPSSATQSNVAMSKDNLHQLDMLLNIGLKTNQLLASERNCHVATRRRLNAELARKNAEIARLRIYCAGASDLA